MSDRHINLLDSFDRAIAACPVVIRTRTKERARQDAAFKLGVEAGRCGWTLPEPARALRLVR